MTTPADKPQFVAVAVPLPLFQTFTYSLPPVFAQGLCIGMRVLVPFGRRRLSGYVVGFPGAGPHQELKEIRDVLDREPLFDENDLKFYQWAARYYCYPIGQTIQTALPPGLTAAYGCAAALTDEGRRALAQPQPGLRGIEILRALDQQEPCSLRRLERTAGGRDFSHHVRCLQQQGLIRVTEMIERSATRIKKEKWFSPAGHADGVRLRGRQQELFQFIAQQQEVALSSLNDRFGNCAAQLRALQSKGAIAVHERELFRQPPAGEAFFVEPVHALTPQQAIILEQLEAITARRKFCPYLLHGVTGSGKTEIYLNVMQRMLGQGRQCLYLVPEIALTSQLWDRIRTRLTVPVAMLHSGMSAAERYDAWRMIRRGEIRVALGARSAVFASFPDLGVIIVDEEHDSSYKQDEKMRYNARDLAIVKARLSDALVILGSATPSLETYHHGLKKKYAAGSLPQRVENKPLPAVKIIDMRLEGRRQKQSAGIVSEALGQALAQRLADGQQSILFLNRRGFSPTFLCRQCGHTFKCPRCEVALVYHRGRQQLSCHYCDFSLPLPEACPACRSFFLMSLGWGTERLEADIARLFPGARIARMDRDTTAARNAPRDIIRRIYQGDIDILIGTQMVVKGLHLPQVTLVGVVCADHALNFPDYRAGERTFQLLTQVAGRAGRGQVSGEVIIQTYNPDHYSVRCAQQHDYAGFYEIEAAYRRDLGYPPFKRLVNLRLEGPVKNQVEARARQLGSTGRRLLEHPDFRTAIELLGPAPAPWQRLNGRYRYQMLLKSSAIRPLHGFVARLLEHEAPGLQQQGLKLIVDVDPLVVM